MKGPTHELLGVSVAAAGAQAAQVPALQAAGLIATAYLASRLPDRLEVLVPHRSVTHWALTAAALTAAVAVGLGIALGPVVALVAGAGFAVGYGGHIAADACTPHGVPALAPFYPRPVWLLPRALRVRTGSWREGLLALTVTLGLAFYLAASYGVIHP